MNLKSFLADLQLSELLPTFEGAGVDFELLETLTEKDLKEMGISQLGARRKIIFALEKTIPINRRDLIEQLEEKEIFRQTINDAPVLITSHRISIGDSALLMSSIKSAAVYTHAEPDRDGELKLSRARAKASYRLVGGLCVLSLSLAALLLISQWYQIILLLVLGGIPGLVLLLSGLRRTRQLVRKEVRSIHRYYLRVETASGPNDMLMSFDKKELDLIVQAIAKAIGRRI